MSTQDRAIFKPHVALGTPVLSSTEVIPSILSGGSAEVVSKLAPLLMGIQDAATYVGVGRSLIYQCIKDGELQLIKIRGRSLLRVSDLNDWVNGHGEQL